MLKEKLKIVWSYIKRYSLYFFFVPLIFALSTIVSLLLSNRNNEKLLGERLKEIREQHKKELEEIQRIKNEEIEKHKLAEKRYQETIKRVQEEKENLIRQLDSNTEKRIKEIIKTNENDPDKMAQGLNDLFGFPIYQDADKLK